VSSSGCGKQVGEGLLAWDCWRQAPAAGPAQPCTHRQAKLGDRANAAALERGKNSFGRRCQELMHALELSRLPCLWGHCQRPLVGLVGATQQRLLLLRAASARHRAEQGWGLAERR
jgi:hypothetical protein